MTLFIYLPSPNRNDTTLSSSKENKRLSTAVIKAIKYYWACRLVSGKDIRLILVVPSDKKIL